MNKYLVYIASFLCLATCFFSCDEVEEVSKYADWQPRNQAFVDSIHALAANDGNLVSQGSDKTEKGVLVKDIAANVMFALETTASTTEGKQYVYCKKIKAQNSGRRPKLTDVVSAYYYGTNILGDSFDGNFKGYSSIDRGMLDKDDAEKSPTEFDSPANFDVNKVIAGWTTALQYMYEGERWMLYVPYQSAYGTSDQSDDIPAYSALTFDVQLHAIK
ncbi:peptidyl-prolyl cis-trans isomerase, FKBP-type [gut metagenome]|uniref:peptidylprolyl isomerase n=1 Tax=gut metagenome TaxID=749906 RepID=J9H7X6_9ZZZZ